MRPIKFRVWDKKENKYLLPENREFVILPTTPSFGVTIPYANVGGNPFIDEECIDWADADLLMGIYELEQFTGLYDKNGVEIYEGDVLAFDKDFDDTDNTFIVYFDGKISAFNFRIYGYNDYISESGSLEYENYKSVIGEMENLERENILFYLEYISVIGNIHENEEWSE